MCPAAGISTCSRRTTLHTEQCFPSVSPLSVQVAGIPLSITSVCPFAGMGPVFFAVQTVHVYSISPSSVQVASVKIFPASQLCSVSTGITCCSSRITPHTEQRFPSVSPLSAQVAGLPGIVSSACPAAVTASVLVS